MLVFFVSGLDMKNRRSTLFFFLLDTIMVHKGTENEQCYKRYSQ